MIIVNVGGVILIVGIIAWIVWDTLRRADDGSKR